MAQPPGFLEELQQDILSRLEAREYPSFLTRVKSAVMPHENGGFVQYERFYYGPREIGFVQYRRMKDGRKVVLTFSRVAHGGFVEGRNLEWLVEKGDINSRYWSQHSDHRKKSYWSDSY